NYWTTGSGPQQQNQIVTAAQNLCSSGFFGDEKTEYDTNGVVTVWGSYNHHLPESDNSNFGQSVYVIVTPPNIQSDQGPKVYGYNTATYHSLNFSYVS